VRIKPPKRRLAATTACGVAALTAWSGLASAASPPSSSQLRKIGSSPKAARTQPRKGLGATQSTQPLIVVSFANGRASVLGGSAVPASSVKAHKSNVPISATTCSVNFTTQATKISGGSTNARWFGGISCNQKVQLFGQAYLAKSATKFDGKGNYYNGQLSSASSGQKSTIIKESNPSLYVWHATNIYFPQKPARGVIVVMPSNSAQINAATTCKVATNSSFGIGVHCDLYSNRF
jgi:hypothetical protein